MRRFNNKLLSFISIFITMLALGIIIGYFSINNSRYFKLSDDTNIIVLGHSYPECAFNDSLIPHLANFGMSGEAYFYTYVKLQKIIPSNKQIKTVLIEFGGAQIDKRMDSWTWDDEHIHNRFPRYFPILGFPDIGFLWQKNWRGILTCPPKSFIHELGYNVITTLKRRSGINETDRFGGYVYLVRDKTDSLIANMHLDNYSPREKTTPEYSDINIRYLSKIVDYCNQNNVEVFFIRSPLHPKNMGNEHEEKMNELLSSTFSNIEFLDFKEYPLANHEFGDLSHLNHKGAKKFSQWFASLLKRGLLKKTYKKSFIDCEIKTRTLDSNLSCDGFDNVSM